MNFEMFFSIIPKEFLQLYATEDDCVKFLSSLKWKNGFICRKCGHNHFCDGNYQGSKRCTKCKTEETLKSNTIFQNCKLPLRTSMHMMLYAMHNPSASTSKMCRELGIRQMTCWRIIQIIKKIQLNNQLTQKQNENTISRTN